jgi:hypothetical protein
MTRLDPYYYFDEVAAPPVATRPAASGAALRASLIERGSLVPVGDTSPESTWLAAQPCLTLDEPPRDVPAVVTAAEFAEILADQADRFGELRQRRPRRSAA